MYKINKDKCTKCGNCAEVCGSEAISKDNEGNYKIDETKCIECGACLAVCEAEAVEEEE